MKTLLYLIALTVIPRLSPPQQSAWNTATNWTLYNVPDAKIWTLPIDSLAAYKSKALNKDSLQQLLTNAELIPTKSPPMWMGAYVATCVLDHKKRKLEISTYGGFFYDEQEKKYFQVALAIQRDWLNYWAVAAAALQSPN